MQLGYAAALAEDKPSVDHLMKKEELARLKKELAISLAFTIPVFLIGMVLHKIPSKNLKKDFP